jgi:hypothetical protein
MTTAELDKVRKMLADGINMQGADPPLNCLVASILTSLLEHIDALTVERDEAIADWIDIAIKPARAAITKASQP